MRFYEIDNVLQEAITTADKPVRLKIQIDRGGHFESIFESDIVEAYFTASKKRRGGDSNSCYA